MDLLKDSGFEEKKILDSIQKLQADGKMTLEEVPPFNRAGDVHGYLLTIALGAITSALVFEVPTNLYPWAYLRNFFGVIFVLFLPGYAFVKAFFQRNKSDQTVSKSLENIEHIAISVGLSMALVSIIGIALYYSPFGLSLTAIVLTLFVLTSVFATVALLKDNKTS